MTLTEETSNQIEMCGVSSKDKCKTFYRLKWKGAGYYAEEYTWTSKTVNSVATVRVRAESEIVIIKQFMLFIGNELLRKQNPSMLQKYRYSQLVQVESQRQPRIVTVLFKSYFPKFKKTLLVYCLLSKQKF